MKKGKRNIIKGCLLILIVIILLLLLRSCVSQQGGYRIEQGIIDLPGKPVAEQMVSDAVEQGMFRIFMNTDIIVNSKNEVDLLIQNNESNTYSTYVEIYNNEEVLYKSGIIKPGYKLERACLTNHLEPGIYNSTAYFHLLDDNNTEINKIGLAITIKKESKDQ